MTMLPRLQLFELEDQSRFSTTIRDLATDYIHFLETKFVLQVPRRAADGGIAAHRGHASG
jgi:hypothetical protein